MKGRGRALLFGAVAALVAFELVLQVVSLVLWSVGSREGAAGGGEREVVLCVGDSFTYGLGASGPDGAYPAALQRLLDRRAPGRFLVLNGGRAGRSTRDVVVELVRQLDEHQPDVVVALAGYNDRWKTPEHLSRAGLPAADELRDAGFPLRWRTGDLLARLFGALAGGGPGTAADGDPDTPQDGPEALLGSWSGPGLDVVFRADGVCAVAGVRSDYRVDGDEVTLGSGPEAVTLRFAREGETLVLEGDGIPGRRARLVRAADRDIQEGFRSIADDPARRFRSEEEVLEACRRLRVDPRESADWYLAAVAAAEGLARDDFAATVEQGLEALDRTDPWRAGLLRIRAGLLEPHDLPGALAATLEAASIDGQDFAAVGWIQGRDRERVAAAVEPALQRLDPDLEQEARLRQLVRRATGADREVAAGIEKHLVLAAELVAEAGARCVLATYPEREPVVDAAIRRAAVAAELPLADAAARFATRLESTAREDLFVADGHCTDAGYALLAEPIAEEILQISGR